MDYEAQPRLVGGGAPRDGTHGQEKSLPPLHSYRFSITIEQIQDQSIPSPFERSHSRTKSDLVENEVSEFNRNKFPFERSVSRAG